MVASQREGPGAGASRLSGRLWVAVRHFDDRLALSVIDRSLSLLPPGEVADLVVVPVLRRLGESWRDDPRLVAVEHFTSQVVRAGFVAHSVLRARGDRLAVCFSPSDDHHDLGVHLAAATLVDAGWQTRILGADTPSATAQAALEGSEPRLAVVGSCMRPAAERFLEGDVVGRCPVLAGGAGFVTADADGSAGLVVHEGPFAAVPRAAERLLERAGAGGA